MAGQVLVADGVATSRILLRVILAAAHYHVRLAADATAAKRLIDTTQPDFILLGDTLEDGPSDDLLRYLRNRPDTRNVPVILLSDRATSERRIAALSAGADELMRKPVGEAALLARMRSLLRAHETTDALDQRQAAVHDLGFAETKAAFAPPAKIALIADDTARAARWAIMTCSQGHSRGRSPMSM
ncbi:MAG: response regulator [Rhodobacteraceae bacterium]|nr:response regulator [Alphaproteobacteria bacterium]NNK66683.1 response regulator [Paracoccaceae bacterium]